MNILHVTFHTFGTNICFLRGEVESEAKIGLFYRVTAVIVCIYIRQMCINETYVRVIVCACLCV